MTDNLKLFIMVLFTAVITLSGTGNSAAETWVKFASLNFDLPGNGRIVKGYSESYYDSDSVQRTGDSRVQVWLKDLTYLGDLEPYIHKELLKIDCGTNGFESLTENGGTSDRLQELNRGTIGNDSPYRTIRETFCGF